MMGVLKQRGQAVILEGDFQELACKEEWPCFKRPHRF